MLDVVNRRLETKAPGQAPMQHVEAFGKAHGRSRHTSERECAPPWRIHRRASWLAEGTCSCSLAVHRPHHDTTAHCAAHTKPQDHSRPPAAMTIPTSTAASSKPPPRDPMEQYLRSLEIRDQRERKHEKYIHISEPTLVLVPPGISMC
jgi:hypothetical protein